VKTLQLTEAILTYPNDAEWNLFDEYGPHVEWTADCGCSISWSFWDGDVTPKVVLCGLLEGEKRCIEVDGCAGCVRCGHRCQEMRPATEAEEQIYAP
jgi:hypothetical protein